MFDYDEMERLVIMEALKCYPDKTEDDIFATFINEEKGVVLFDGHIRFTIDLI